MKCLLKPLNHFGDHTKGFMGCIWCDLNIKCVKFHPTVGRSLLFRQDIEKPKTLIFRLNRILKKGEVMALDKNQKEFIRKKVKELGSPEKVKQFYNKECAVDDYANSIAKKVFVKGE